LGASLQLFLIATVTAAGLTVASWIAFDALSRRPRRVEGHSITVDTGHGHGHGDNHPEESDGHDERSSDKPSGDTTINIDINLDEITDRLSAIEGMIAPTWGRRAKSLASNVFYAALGALISIALPVLIPGLA